MRIAARLIRTVVIVLPLVAGSASAAGGPKGVMTNPGTAPEFLNCTSSGSYTFSATDTASLATVQIKKLQGVGNTDQTPCTADDYICLIDAVANLSGALIPCTIVLHGEVTKGQIKIKHDFCAENSSMCSPIPMLPVSTTGISCYKPDPSFAPSLILRGTNACEGVAIFGLTPPASQLIAVDGITAACP